MRLAKLIVFAVCAAIVITACSQSSLNSNKMSSDEKVFRAKCRACHRLQDPSSHTNTEWAEILDEHEGRIELTPEQRESVLRHLQTSQKPALP